MESVKSESTVEFQELSLREIVDNMKKYAYSTMTKCIAKILDGALNSVESGVRTEVYVLEIFNHIKSIYGNCILPENYDSRFQSNYLRLCSYFYMKHGEYYKKFREVGFRLPDDNMPIVERNHFLEKLFSTFRVFEHCKQYDDFISKIKKMPNDEFVLFIEENYPQFAYFDMAPDWIKNPLNYYSGECDKKGKIGEIFDSTIYCLYVHCGGRENISVHGLNHFDTIDVCI